MQVLVGVMVLCVLPSALLVRAPAAIWTSEAPTSGATLRHALTGPAVYRALLVLGLAGAANSAVLLHQVAVLEAAGLTLAAASGFAGARGACQIGGRLLLMPLTARLGLRGTIGVSYGVAMTATLALLAALVQPSAFVPAACFAVVGSMSQGLLSPLNGLFQAEVYGDARLGTLSGVTVVVVSLASAGGSALAGVIIDVTGGHEAMLMTAIVVQALAIAALLWQGAAGKGAPAGASVLLETSAVAAESSR